MIDAVHWYDAHAIELAKSYESIEAERVHAWMADLLPTGPGIALDVGAGTGRDAAWLSQRGFDVVAAEPSRAMREQATRLRPDSSVTWVLDGLPDLREVLRMGLSFDLILLSGVWMHVPLAERPRAFRKLVTLLKPGGLMAITLRRGPAEADRGMLPVSEEEIDRLARDHGAFIERRRLEADKLGRPGVEWVQLAVRMPDDGTGALPLFRHVILNDDKSSTYKLALLRALSRIADSVAGYAHPGKGGHVSVPLGLVALYWVRLFKPLLDADLPQSPTNRGLDKLGFVRDGFRRLGEVSHLDLRVGMIFAGDRANALHGALRDASRTIATMPATYLTYPNGGPVFPVRPNAASRRPTTITLDEAYLSTFGDLEVPLHLWKALQRFDVWIEPALVAEWVRLMHRYAESQGRVLAEQTIARAMRWSEPGRDVRIARDRAAQLLGGGALHCVWTGRMLSARSLDVDHCFPWAAWPCDHLWNLMPAHRHVNQREKRDRLPSDSALRGARERILDWWGRGYVSDGSGALAQRFMTEVRAGLPALPPGDVGLDDVFAGPALQRMRLDHDQQIPEWSTPAATGAAAGEVI